MFIQYHNVILSIKRTTIPGSVIAIHEGWDH